MRYLLRKKVGVAVVMGGFAITTATEACALTKK